MYSISREAVGGDAAALPRAMKRREALATGSPFATAIVGVCDTCLYSQGILLYTLDEKIRILDVYGSAKGESVVDFRALLNSQQSMAPTSDFCISATILSLACISQRGSPGSSHLTCGKEQSFSTTS
jgi:hypothetical protein